MRNFGKSIGSKDWISEPAFTTDSRVFASSNGGLRAAGAGSDALPDVLGRFPLGWKTVNLELLLHRGIQLFN